MLVPCLAQLLSWKDGFGALQNPLHHERVNQLPLKVSDEVHAAGYIDGVRSGTTGASLTINVQNDTRNDTAPYLGGLLFEDIAHSGDGGLYAELLRNRAFQGSGISMGDIPQIPYRSIVYSENPVIPFGPVLDGWSAIGDAKLSLDLLHPLSDALQVSLQVDVPLNATGRVGIQNDGFWGIPVLPQIYNASFHVQANGVRFNWTLTSFDVELRSALEKEKIYCSSTIPIHNRLTPYQPRKFETRIPCEVKAPNLNNTFAITFDASEARGQTLYFSLLSLFPPTYKDRPNGLRKDLADHVEALNPKFLRFPGGNNLEGYSVQRRWKWWKTIGPLEDRPGRPGDWSYYNTDGLGLLEYLQWCEDMRVQPLLALWAGFSLDIAVYDAGNSTDANEAALEQMPAVLDEALQELEYCMGDAVNTYWGRKRAQHGHPEPFWIEMVEIGNEDWFSHAYDMRAEFMHKGIRKVYPDMEFVFSAFDESKEFVTKIPEGGIWDSHVYAPAGWFIRNHNYWDNFQTTPEHERPNHPVDPPPPDNLALARKRKIDPSKVLGSLLEYHASAVGVNGVPNTHPRIGAAVAEAVYAIGGERNPNVYKLSCFAPLMQNINAWRHTPYDLLFSSEVGEGTVVRSASYWQQWLFNRYPGRQTVEVQEMVEEGEEGAWNPLFWVASIDELSGVDELGHQKKMGKRRSAVFFKIVNAGNTTQILDLHLDVPFTTVNGTILEPPTEGDLFAYNDFGHDDIVPKAVKDLHDLDSGGKWVMEGGEGRDLWSGLRWTVPASSISVLQFDLAGYYPSAADTKAPTEDDKGTTQIPEQLTDEL